MLSKVILLGCCCIGAKQLHLQIYVHIHSYVYTFTHPSTLTNLKLSTHLHILSMQLQNSTLTYKQFCENNRTPHQIHYGFKVYEFTPFICAQSSIQYANNTCGEINLKKANLALCTLTTLYTSKLDIQSFKIKIEVDKSHRMRTYVKFNLHFLSYSNMFSHDTRQNEKKTAA